MDQPNCSETSYIDAYCMGRAWNHQEPHFLSIQLRYFLEALASATRRSVRYLHYEKDMPSSDVVVMNPGFQLPGGKAAKSTMKVLMDNKYRGAKSILFTGDVELLSWWKFVDEHKIPHGLVTSFLTPWKMWAATRVEYFEHYTYYPTHEIRVPETDVQPKFGAMYVGWPKPARFSILKKIGYTGLVMAGFGADKQDVFRSALCHGYTFYPYLWDLYSAGAWHVCVSDPIINAVQPAVCRHLEAWRCRRPCAFHKSFMESRPKVPTWPGGVDWSAVKEWCFESAADLHEIQKIGWDPITKTYDLDLLADVARRQEEALRPQIHQARPTVGLSAMWVNSPQGEWT